MKKLFFFFMLIPFLGLAQSTNVVGTNVVANQSLTLHGVKISDIQRDSMLRDSFKVPTSKAVYDFVRGRINSLDSNKWGLTGNTISSGYYIGTNNDQDLVFKRNGVEGLRLVNREIQTPKIYLNGGYNDSSAIIYADHPGYGKIPFIHTFQKSGTDGDNLFFGLVSGNRTMTGSAGIQGSYNLGIGSGVLSNNTTGYRNTGIGIYALQNNTSGQGNTATGQNSLTTNTSGERNVATGMRSMALNTSGFANVAVGFDALFGNTTADHNTAVGLDALYYSNGSHNTAVGDSTLWGIYNTQKHMGYKNTAIGSRAGFHLGNTYSNYASIFDTAVTFIGANSSRDSSIPYTTSLQNSTAIGYNARIFASNQISLGDENITTTLLRGNVGINTRTPDSALTVTTGIWGKRGVRFSDLPTTAQARIAMFDATGNLYSVDTTGLMSGGGGGSQDLQSVTDLGNTTTNDIQLNDGALDYTIIGTDAGTGYFRFRSSTNYIDAIFANNFLSSARTYTLPNNSGTLTLGTGTSNELTYWSGTNTVSTLSTATYPSLTELSYVKGVTSAIQSQIDNKQPLDADLTTIAGLTATTDNFIVSVASAWASRTPSQVRTTLGLGTFALKNLNDNIDVTGSWNFRNAGGIGIGTVGHTGSFYPGGLTTDQSYDLPNQSGTLALTTDISAYIAVAISGTTNEIAYFNTDNTVASLSTATYPSLTELSYVKGATSSIQTQLSNKQPLDADLTTWAGITPSANIQSFLGAADYAAMRTQLGLVIGTNVQAYDADLTTYAGITPSSNVQSLLGAADYAAMRTQLGLVIGTNVQAYDADLTTWASITPSANIQSFNSAANYAAARVLLLPSLTGNSLKTLRVNASETDVEWAAGGSGDMVLASSQSVTGLKTFDKDKFAMKGTSTGVTVLSTANTSATDYTVTWPAANVTSSNFTDLINATSASTASTLTKRDANGNTSVKNIVDSYTSTATAAGTTTLTVSSTFYQNFSGTSTQTVTLPDATTLTNGHQFYIDDASTGNITINKNGGTLLQTLPASRYAIVTLTDNSTSAGTWTVQLSTPPTEFIRQSSTYTLSNTTNVQKLFNASTNGALTVKATTTYNFEGVINISGMSGTSGNMKFDILGAGTATLTSAGWCAIGLDNTTVGTAAANGGSYTATKVSSGNIVTAGAGTAVYAYVKGTFTVNAGGTIIPSVGLTTAVGTAAVGVNTWISVTEILPGGTNYTSGWN